MVGDGLNDPAALAAAHVSVAPASARDVARVAAGSVMLGMDLALLAEAADLARNPKRLPRLDRVRLARAHDALTRHLSRLGRSERRRDALRGIATSVVLSLLLVAALFVATLVWRGFL